MEEARNQLGVRVIERTRELDSANLRLKAEVAMRKQSETLFRSLAEYSPDFIFILDLTANRWTYANRSELMGHLVARESSPTELHSWGASRGYESRAGRPSTIADRHGAD